MPGRTRFWRIFVSVLLIVLVLTTTMGMVWHHHDQCTAGKCTLCHMVIAPPAAMILCPGLPIWAAVSTMPSAVFTL